MKESNDMSVKDELVPQTVGQKDPYSAKGSDWPDGKSKGDVRTGQTSGATHESPDAGGKDMLAEYTQNQCGPRHVEDDGPGEKGSGTPVPVDRAARVSSAFPIETNKGESDISGMKVNLPETINLSTGMIECAGYSKTRVGEVPQSNVTIG